MTHATAVDPPSSRRSAHARSGARPGGAAGTNARRPGPAGSSSPRSPSSSSPSWSCPSLYAFYLSLYSKGLATGVVFAGAEELRQRLHRPVVPQGGLVRRPVRGGADPGADGRLARARAGAGRPHHAVRPVRPADDLPALRDPGGDRRVDVGLPLQPDLRADAADLRHLRRPTRRSCSTRTTSSAA